MIRRWDSDGSTEYDRNTMGAVDFRGSSYVSSGGKSVMPMTPGGSDQEFFLHPGGMRLEGVGVSTSLSTTIDLDMSKHLSWMPTA